MKIVGIVGASALFALLAACSSTNQTSVQGNDAGNTMDSAAGLDSGAPGDTGSAQDSASANDTGTGPEAASEASTGFETGAPETGSTKEAGADGGSPYDTTCTSSSMSCPGTGLICQTFSFGGGAINGYACTKTCTTTADCDAPGAPSVQCLPFTTASFCVITCDATSATSCPGSLKCAADQGQPGICVSF